MSFRLLPFQIWSLFAWILKVPTQIRGPTRTGRGRAVVAGRSRCMNRINRRPRSNTFLKAAIKTPPIEMTGKGIMVAFLTMAASTAVTLVAAARRAGRTADCLEGESAA